MLLTWNAHPNTHPHTTYTQTHTHIHTQLPLQNWIIWRKLMNRFAAKCMEFHLVVLNFTSLYASIPIHYYNIINYTNAYMRSVNICELLWMRLPSAIAMLYIFKRTCLLSATSEIIVFIVSIVDFTAGCSYINLATWSHTNNPIEEHVYIYIYIYMYLYTCIYIYVH